MNKSFIKTYCIRVGQVGVAFIVMALGMSLVSPYLQTEPSPQAAAPARAGKPMLSDMTLFSVDNGGAGKPAKRADGEKKNPAQVLTPSQNQSK